jgi:hypothetical protein
MSELDDLERDLLVAADIWFNQDLHKKLQRLIAIARDGESWREYAAAVVAHQAAQRIPPKSPSDPVRREPTSADPIPPIPTSWCESSK